LQAIANGASLPGRASGTALFADISGFTALTESLRETLGTRQGAEELTRQLGAVYSALIAEIEKYGGSVIGFAGDSMLCWFDDELLKGKPGVRGPGTAYQAVACAFRMQEVIQAFPGLGLKVAIASGGARRFLVGDASIRKIDALAGVTVARTASAEHLAVKGDVLVDEATAGALGEAVVVREWRSDEGSGEKFAAVGRGPGSAKQKAMAVEPEAAAVDPESLRPFIHQAVYDRETSGQGAFLTEFRPCLALFVRFTGIDYEADDAGAGLDGFVQTLQRTAERYGGTLLQVTVGDKGSYAHLNFGALSAHEDDARRATKTALELIKISELNLQIGIAQGLMRVGVFGGKTRRTYDALGDDVNLAARLMTTAAAGEILLSGRVHEAVIEDFTFEPRPPLPMKGKAEPLPVFAVTGETQKRAVRLQEPTYALPMVGRREELRSIEAKLDLAAEGRGQVVGIVAEAGMGKSRLVAEVIRSARRKGFTGFGGACQSDGIHTPYLAWKPIWEAFFDVDPGMPERKLVRWLEGEIEDLAPSRVEAMPLLSTVLDLNIPENDFTRNLEPETRQSALHALLEDCLKSAAGTGAAPAPNEDAGANEKGERTSPLLIVVEDLHWIDALSQDLLEELAKALANSAVCFVLAYRPPELERLQAARLEALPQFTRVELRELTPAEAESAVRAKLLQLYPARGGALPGGLVDALMARAQGNPFYLEELLNYVRDRGLDPSDIENIELPDSLHTLILSRIDRLSEEEKTTLRVASIIGRLFRARWLTGYYPELGTPAQVKAALDALESLDITPLDTPEPELAYLFKHIVTHEVTYESLPFATRSRLHEQLGRYLEGADAPLDTIAFHYGRSGNQDKKREYLRRAGEAAQRNFANDAALDYYTRLLPLLEDSQARVEIQMRRGAVLELTGQYDEAQADYQAVLDVAREDPRTTASAQYAMGKLNRLRGDYEAALAWMAQAKQGYDALGDPVGVARALIEKGRVLNHKGEPLPAREALDEALQLARAANARREVALALNNLGAAVWYQGDYVAARPLYEEGLALMRELGDKPGIAAALYSLGVMAVSEGNIAETRSRYQESLALRREIGDKRGISSALAGLGAVKIMDNDYPAARTLLEESLALRREMGDRKGIAGSLASLGAVYARQGDYATARALFEEGLLLARETGDRRGTAVLLVIMGTLVMGLGDYAAARALYDESLALRRDMGDKWGVAATLCNLGNLARAQADYAGARSLFEESLALCEEIDDKWVSAKAWLGLGMVELAQGADEAREHILRSVRMSNELEDQMHPTSCLIGLAGLALQEGDPRRAAHFLGAAESALKAANIVVDPEYQSFHAQTLTVVREALGEEGFRSAWEEGARWSLEEAVKKALRE
jgi:adenylate cyclase